MGTPWAQSEKRDMFYRHRATRQQMTVRYIRCGNGLVLLHNLNHLITSFYTGHCLHLCEAKQVFSEARLVPKYCTSSNQSTKDHSHRHSFSTSYTVVQLKNLPSDCLYTRRVHNSVHLGICMQTEEVIKILIQNDGFTSKFKLERVC